VGVEWHVPMVVWTEPLTDQSHHHDWDILWEISRDGRETLKPETETRPRIPPPETETRRLYVTRRYRDVKIGLHVVMIADVNLFSRPLIIIGLIIITANSDYYFGSFY